jgi:hypothetical protein
MTATLTSEIKASLSWLFQDALDLSLVSDSSKLDYQIALPHGAGAEQADKVWHDERTLAAGASENVILSALPLEMFGGNWTISLASVKAILLVNGASAPGENLVLGGAASQAWQGPFAAAGDKLVVPADSCLLLVNKKAGWAVNAGVADMLRIANAGAGSITYKIAILGVSV